MTPSDERRLHPLTPFFDLILFGRQLAGPIVLALVAGRGTDRTELVFVLPVVLGTLYGLARWWRFTYSFDGTRFVIDEGVLTRKRRVIPLDRVQQVEMRSKLRHRLLGVTVLRVDTAGSGGDAEVDLSVVSVAEAARLRSILLPDAGPDSSASELPISEPARPRRGREGGDVLVRLSPWRLALAGMTGAELALMLTLVGWLAQVVDDLSVDIVGNLDDRLSAPTSVPRFAAAALTFLVVWFGLAGITGVIKNFGFEMRRSGSDLRVRRGLFERRDGSMPQRRLQAVVVAQSVVRRGLGFASLGLQSAGQATGTSGGVARIDVPLLATTEVEPLLRELLPVPSEWSLTRLVGHPPAAQRRAIVRRVVIAVVLVAGPATLLLRGAAGAALLALAVVVAALAGELAYRGLGHASVGGIVTARAGGVARRTDVVPAARVQSTRLRTSPLQRRAGLATLSLEVAGKGRTPTIREADGRELHVLQAALASSSPAKSDEQEIRARAALASSLV